MMSKGNGVDAAASVTQSQRMVINGVPQNMTQLEKIKNMSYEELLEK